MRSASGGSKIYIFANRFTQCAEAATKTAGKAQGWNYIDYASHDQDQFGGYEGENRWMMIQVQKEVHPLGAFTSGGLCRGYFKFV